MRPLPGDSAYSGRSRSSSGDNDMTPLAARTHPPQMTYFLADEKSMESSLAGLSSILPKQHDSKSSNYGVESLETTTASLAPDNDDSEESLRKARHNWKKGLGLQISRDSEEDLESLGSPSMKSFGDLSRNVSPSHQRRASQATISRPFTPLSFASPALQSSPGTPDSRRNSDAVSFMDDIRSQAVVSSGDEEGVPTSDLVDSGSAPQLVMPSIKMPSRRPFTEKGRNMGRLKVLVAGDSGIGKSSLIKAIVQTCEDIVHVDPLSTTPIEIPGTRRRSRTAPRSGASDTHITTRINEVHASTRTYPNWWSDLEESKILRRRKSLGDSVLERNLCFVDTPGYGYKTSYLECITPVVDYMESHFKKAMSLDGMTESDMVNLLSGNGGSQVDLVLYAIHNRVKPVDLEYLRRLSHLSNVIPVIAQADLLSPEELDLVKENIRSELYNADIQTFVFAHPGDFSLSNTPSSTTYAISTRPSKDLEAMDASLLMSPDYVQPLISSDLPHLVSQIFSRDSIAHLRYSAAKKFLQWRSSSTPISRPQGLYRPLNSGLSSSLTSSIGPLMSAPVGATTSYALARITDHTQREERIAQVRLANWAADLQRSLQNERMRYESLARSERAVWLTERLGECVQDGTIVPISQARQSDLKFDHASNALVKSGVCSRRRHGQGMAGSLGVDRHDPLGLLQLNKEFKKKAWVLVKVMSGFGILGGLALWLVRGSQLQNAAVWGMGGLTVSDMIDFGVLDWAAS